MEFLQRIEPHLLSDDPIVLEFVLRVLEDYPAVPPEWTDRLLKEAMRSKKKETLILSHLKSHSLNDGAVQALIQGLQRKNKKLDYEYKGLINKIRPEQAMRFKAELQPFIKREMWDFYQLLLNGSEEEVWTEYGGALAELDGSPDYDHELFIKAKMLAEVIVQNGWFSQSDTDIVMREQLEKGEWFDFEGILNVYFIKLLQQKRFIPQLTSLLVRNEDVLLEEVADALSFFQSDEVVKEVAPYVINNDSDIYSFSIIRNIKTPLATKVLLDARNHVEEDSRELLIESLCFQLSPDVVPTLEEMLHEGYTTFITELETSLYGFYRIMGLTHPELEEWKRTAEERNEHFLKDMGVVEPKPKVGRNDPCICGSGKKYKKCCGA